MSHDTSGWSWREFWLGLDRWIHAWPIPWLGFGKSTETISSKLGRAHEHWWARVLCRFLSLFHRDHCRKAAHGATGPRETKKPPPATGRIDPATRRRLEALVAKKAAKSSRPPTRPTEAP